MKDIINEKLSPAVEEIFNIKYKYLFLNIYIYIFRNYNIINTPKIVI